MPASKATLRRRKNRARKTPVLGLRGVGLFPNSDSPLTTVIQSSVRDDNTYTAPMKHYHTPFEKCNKNCVDLAVLEMSKHGHPFFYEQTKKEEELHDAKNRGYAGSGAPLGNFERVAKIYQIYGLSFNLSDPIGVLISYLMKHFDNIMFNYTQGTVSKESVEESMTDMSVYFKIMRCLIQDMRKKNA